MLRVKSLGRRLFFSLISLLALRARAGEADIKIPDLHGVSFQIGGSSISGLILLYAGLGVCVLGALFGLVQYRQTRALPVHESMRAVSNIIWETCKTYLQQQGRFLIILWLLIAACIFYYFKGLQQNTLGHVLMILLCSIFGILGSY